MTGYLKGLEMTLRWLKAGDCIRTLMAFPCRYLFFACVLCFGAVGPVEAQFLSVTFEDQSEDHVGKMDLVRLTLIFDQASGEYEVLLEADEGAKFQGDFLIGINLFNGDRGTTALDPSYFHAEAEVLAFDCASLRYRLVGFDPRLRSWSLGDRIAASGPEPLGLPAGFTFFKSGLASAEDSVQGEDLVGDGVIGILQNASGFASYNVFPTAFDDAFEVLEDASTQAFDVLRNDCSQEGAGPLEMTQIEMESVRGDIELLDGVIFYTPPKDFYGTEILAYVVSDVQGNTDRGTVTITVVSVNDPPIAKDDVIEINLRESRYVLDVLENDSTEPDVGEVLSLVGVEDHPSLGSLSIEGNQLVLETAKQFRGEASFTYSVSDGNGGMADATVRVSVEQPNVDPTAVDDFVLGFEDSVLVIDVLANDTSAPDEGEVLFIASVGESHAGAKMSVRDGKILYEAAPNFYGNDLFTYQIGDGFGGSSHASVHVTIANTNDPPSVENDSVEIVADGNPYIVKPLLNDRSDPDPPEVLVLREIRYSGDSAIVLARGDLISVMPKPGFVGSFEFDYVVRDQNGGEAIGNVSVSVLQFQVSPSANSDSVKIEGEGNIATIDVLANDTTVPDRNGVLKIASLIGAGVSGSGLRHDGEFVYLEPKEGFESGWFRYTIVDEKGAQDSALVVVTESPIEEIPAANDDFVVVLEDEGSILDVIQNDYISPSFEGTSVLSIVNGPTMGRAVFNEQGMIEYRPDKDFYGKDSLQYSITYPSGNSDVAELLIEVENTNDPPLAVDDEYEVLEDSWAIRLDVLSNDTSLPDPDDRLTLIAANRSEHGSVVRAEGDWVVYQPVENFFGKDSFVYSIRDDNGEIALGRVDVTILSVNDPPRAMPDSVEVDSGSDKVFIDVLANDSSSPDIDERLRVFSVSQGEFGGAVNIEGHQVFYSPPDEIVTMDQFEYSVSDGNGGVSSASVSVAIRQVDRMPRGAADEFVVMEDATRVRLDVLSNDQSGSVSGEKMFISSLDQPTNKGNAVIGSNAIHFTPAPNFVGTVSLSYRVGEGDFESEPVSVKIDVGSVNDPPVVVDDRVSLEDPGSSVLIDVLANDSSGVDQNETLSIEFVSVASAGSKVDVVEGKVRYQPVPKFSGQEEFMYRVSDGNGGQATATVKVQVKRSDRLAPVIVCRDVALEMPASGELVLDPMLFDGGSFDESGELELVVLPSRFDITAAGVKEVILQGTDGSGNVSTCTAQLTIIEPVQDQIQLVHPKNRSVFRVSEDYLFNASDIPVEVNIEGEFETIEIIGDGGTLWSGPHTAGQTSVIWQWEEARWGDHEIIVVGHQADGVVVKSLPARFSVSELASHVAMAVPAMGDDGGDIELIAEYLFEMGVNLEIFAEPLPSDFADQAWDSVIWNDLGHRGISEGSIFAFEEVVQRGVGLYLMGTEMFDVNGISNESRESWEQLTLMTGAQEQVQDGLIDLLKEGDERLVKGRFGVVTRFDLEETEGGHLVVPEADALIHLDGLDLAASLELPRTALGEGGRRFVQLFSLGNAEAEYQLKTLFQNAVCWLLPDCFDCVNSDLPPVLHAEPQDLVLGRSFSIELLLENNGACEVSGAEVGLLADGVEVVQLLIDGVVVPAQLDSALGYWRGPVGRVGKGSDSAIIAKWVLRVTDPSIDKLEFETQSNNTARATVEAEIDVTSMSIVGTASGVLALKIDGGPDRIIELEYTDSLLEPIRWENVSPPIVTNREGTAIREMETAGAARFYRIKVAEP